MPKETKKEKPEPIRTQVKDYGKGVDSVSIFKFNTKTLNDLASGSCIITETNTDGKSAPEKVAVCKEGETIKIFKIAKPTKGSNETCQTDL
jgi:hypothetical protein